MAIIRSSGHAASDGIASERPNIISLRILANRMPAADQFEIPERVTDIADQHRAGEAAIGYHELLVGAVP